MIRRRIKPTRILVCAVLGVSLATPSAVGADPLANRGYQVTAGAAPGYVDDQVCGSCHADLYDSYQEVAMARSFYRPRRSTAVEDFEHGFFHAKSKRHYRIFLRDERYVFQRHLLDAAGQPINVFEQEIDWVLGSGNHSPNLPLPHTRRRALPAAPGLVRGAWSLGHGSRLRPAEP